MASLHSFWRIDLSLALANCVIFLLWMSGSIAFLCLVVLGHSGRNEFLLHCSYFPEKLKTLEGNWFFSSALSLR